MQRNASTPGRSAPLNLIQSFATRPPQAPRLSRRPELMERKRTIAVHSKLGVATDLLLQVLGLTIRLRCELLMRVLWMSEPRLRHLGDTRSLVPGGFTGEP